MIHYDVLSDRQWCQYGITFSRHPRDAAIWIQPVVCQKAELNANILCSIIIRNEASVGGPMTNKFFFLTKIQPAYQLRHKVIQPDIWIKTDVIRFGCLRFSKKDYRPPIEANAIWFDPSTNHAPFSKWSVNCWYCGTSSWPWVEYDPGGRQKRRCRSTRKMFRKFTAVNRFIQLVPNGKQSTGFKPRPSDVSPKILGTHVTTAPTWRPLPVLSHCNQL